MQGCPACSNGFYVPCVRMRTRSVRNMCSIMHKNALRYLLTCQAAYPEKNRHQMPDVHLSRREPHAQPAVNLNACKRGFYCVIFN